MATMVLERRQSTFEALRESSASFRMLADYVADSAVYLLDPEGHVATWNTGAERLKQYTAGEIIGKDFACFYLPEDIADGKPAADLARALAEGRVDYESWRRRKDESLFRAHVVITPVFNDDGLHLGFGKVTRDISRELSQAHMRSVLDHVLDGIFSTDEHGIIQSFNLAAEGIFGFRQSDVIGQDVKLLFAEQAGGEAHALLGSFLKPGTGSRTGITQLLGRRKDSSTFPMELSISDFELEGRLFYTGIVHDLSERVLAEATLQRSQLQMEKAQQRGHIGHWELDVASNHTTWSDELYRIYDLPPQAATADPALTVSIHPADRARVEGAIETARNDGGDDFQFDYRILPADGSTRYLELRGESIVDAAGRPETLEGTVQDITDRTMAQQELEQSVSRMSAILDHASDAIVSVDDQGLVASFNPAAEATFGYTQREIIGQPLLWLAAEEDHARITALTGRIISGELAHGTRLETQAVRKNGAVFPLEMSLSGFQLGDRHYMMGISRDVSERRKLEDQLRQGQKMEAVGRLAGGVAHDFNNLLTVIIGYSQMTLAKLPPDDELHEYTTEVLHAGERAALLTQQLLAFSRQQVLAPRILNLNTVVGETERMLQRLIGEDINIATSLEPQLSPIMVDQGQIVQVVMNLAVNARDAMPQGGKLSIMTSNIYLDSEHVSERPDFLPGPHVLLSVSDNGAGMTPEVVARIFEPFFTTKGPGEGSGLGLAMVYGIVKQSGGQIQVYSEPGIGTTFKIYFPAVESDTAHHQVEEAAKPTGGNETILLVEDDAAVRKVTVVVLETQGYKLVVATTAREALELAATSTEKIDLLLTDLIMPEMSGRQVAEAVQLLLPGIKVLYMSGYTDDAVVRHGLVTDSVSFLQKPFTSISLSHKVRDVLDKTV